MHDDVAADDRHALVGAVEAHVLGAVGIDMHALGDEGVAIRGLNRRAVGAEQAQRAFGGAGGEGGGGEGGEDGHGQEALGVQHG